MSRVLTVISGASRGLQVRFEDEPAFQVGSSARADLVLDDPAVADVHLTLFLLEGAVHCHDLSGRGFHVNGAPTRRAVLAAGDVIGLGPCALQLLVDATPAPRSDAGKSWRDTDRLQAVGVDAALLARSARARPAGRKGDTSVDVRPAQAAGAGLTVVRGQAGAPFVELAPDQTTLIGRGDANDLVLLDERASRVHCRVDPRGDGYVLTDLDSSNGTEVDGVAVEAAWLHHGSTIRIGATELRFLRGVPAKTPPPLAW